MYICIHCAQYTNVYVYICLYMLHVSIYVYRYIQVYVCTCDHTLLMYTYLYTLHVYTLWTYIHACNVLHSYRNRPLIDAFLMIFMVFSCLLHVYWQFRSQWSYQRILSILTDWRKWRVGNIHEVSRIASGDRWKIHLTFPFRIPNVAYVCHVTPEKNTSFMVNNLPFRRWFCCHGQETAGLVAV